MRQSILTHLDTIKYTVRRNAVKKQLFSTLIILLSLSGLIFSGSVQARMKCWKNNEGVRECGDKIPPEFAQKSHEELGKGGLVRDKTKRALTDEELVKQRRLDKIKAAEEKELAKQKKKDEILLNTFSNVEDIERARDERVTALEAAISLTKGRNEKINRELDKRIKKAASAERAGKTPSEALLKDIESLKRQLKNNEIFIEGKHAEQEIIKTEHAKDIAHFKKLKGISD